MAAEVSLTAGTAMEISSLNFLPGVDFHAKLETLPAKCPCFSRLPKPRNTLPSLLSMIKLTKMNGHDCLLNHLLIEIIEESPDTCITLSNGNRYIVLESAEEIREKIIVYSAEIMRRAGYNPQLPQDGK